jgi:serine/threonine protein phosphatase PrpC
MLCAIRSRHLATPIACDPPGERRRDEFLVFQGIEDMVDDHSRDLAGQPPDNTASPPLLAPGTIVGDYLIVRDLSARGDRIEYLAQVAPDEHTPPSGREPFLRVVAAPAGSLDHMRAIDRLQLRHPRLLAVREVFELEDVDYAVIDIPGDTWPPDAPPALSPEEALALGVLVGDVLAYLHSQGVVHGHIIPSALIVAPSGVFLAGIEDATVPPEPNAAIAADVNALASAVAALADCAGSDSATCASLAMIAERAATGSFTMMVDLMHALRDALPDGLPALSDEAAVAPLVVRFGFATSVGLVREQNQDAVGALALEIADDLPQETPGGIFLVADGMGGEAQGEVASRIAVRVIVAEVARRFVGPAARASATDTPAGEQIAGEAATQMNLDGMTALIEAFRAANARIRNMVRRLERPAGTTATAVMIFGHEAIVGHVGDSRAYLVRGGELARLTHDHSLVQKLIDLGQYHPGESEFDVPRNYLYRSLGQADDLDVDTWAFKLGAGDLLLICSDGLWDLVPAEDMRDVLTSGHSPEEIARALVDKANAAGGLDNSTALVVRLDQRPQG